LRTRVVGPDADRWLSPEIDAAVELTRAGQFVDAAESAIGPLA
jgi:histidine ammonia-lyase